MATSQSRSANAAEAASEPSLLAPLEHFEEALVDRVAKGEELLAREFPSISELKTAWDASDAWDQYNTTLLRRSFSTSKIADEYSQSGSPVERENAYSLSWNVGQFTENVQSHLQNLRSLQERLPLYSSTGVTRSTTAESFGDGVFIVHGRNEALKHQVARIVERLTGTAPIILHEHADGGRTIIEKFEEYANRVGYAVVLLTADDHGGLISKDELRPRGRQNVVFELGFFIGRLGRPRVTVLYEDGVELPSDMSGVLFTLADDRGAWQLKLASEMKNAGIPVDLNKMA